MNLPAESPRVDLVPRPVGRLAPVPRPARPVSWERRLLGWHSLLVYLFLYVPIAILILYSFNRSKQTAAWEGFTFDWYLRLFQNDLILRAVKNSLIVATITTVLATIIGTLAALALARGKFRGKSATQAALYLPIIIPEIVIGAALVTFFGVARMRLGLTTVVIAHVAFCISYVAIVVRARLAGFDRSLEEAASDLGAGPWDTFRRVTLPIILPGIVAGLCWSSRSRSTTTSSPLSSPASAPPPCPSRSTPCSKSA